MARDAYHHLLIPGAPGAPLLVLFHGTGGNEMQLLPIAQSVFPDAGVLSPRGDANEGGAARFFRRRGEGDYDMDDLARATDKMAGFVRTHAEEQKPGGLFGLGYSNGANILASMLFSEPALFEAAVLMHPLIPFKPKIAEESFKTRVLITAGRADPICPPSTTRRLQSYLKAAGAQTEITWHQGGHELRPGEIEAAHQFLTR